MIRWWVHNLIAHPLLVLFPALGRWLHDRTAPAASAPATAFVLVTKGNAAHGMEPGLLVIRTVYIEREPAAAFCAEVNADLDFECFEVAPVRLRPQALPRARTRRRLQS